MSAVEDEPVLELDELLDSSRLAAAWQVAHERAVEEAVAVADAQAAAAVPVEAPAASAFTVPAASAPAPAPAPPPAASPTPAIPPPLPVAVAHHVLLDELARLRSLSPELAAQAEAVLAVPLEQLAAALDPLDATAAEKLLDDLEDLLQSLLMPAGWPTAGEE